MAGGLSLGSVGKNNVEVSSGMVSREYFKWYPAGVLGPQRDPNAIGLLQSVWITAC